MQERGHGGRHLRLDVCMIGGGLLGPLQVSSDAAVYASPPKLTLYSLLELNGSRGRRGHGLVPDVWSRCTWRLSP
jgi:hypothetical protein